MGHYRNFTLATYFVAHAAARITQEQLERQLQFMEKHMRLDKVYLEPWRGELASPEQIDMIRRVFQRHDVQVAGGLTTVIPTPEGETPKPRMFDTICYTDERMRAKLREVSALIARQFDEFIIDDFFFTDCACPSCIAARDAYNKKMGTKGWQAFRLDLMRRVSQEDVIAPAKAANPRCQITIKYPNWAESYQETGYNPAAQRHLFDQVYTGTETRDPVATDQHLPRYLSFSLMTYFESMWPRHNGGGWFDTFDTHVTEHYLEQAYLTAFSKPQELMLFCFQSLQDNMYTPALGFQLDRLDAVLDHAGAPVGIACYLPDDCQGEDNVQDFLGMVGLPIVRTPFFPQESGQILLTRSSACDPAIVDKLKAYLNAPGHTAVVTSGFWDAVKDRGYEDLTSIRLRGRRVSASAYRVEEQSPAGWPACTFPTGDRPISIPVAEFRNNATWAVVKAVHGEESYGLLLRDDQGLGRLYTLVIPDAFPDLYRLPAPVLSRIRQALPVHGAWLEGPARISLFVYDNDSLIVYPYVMDGAQRQIVRLHVAGATALRALPRDTRIEPLYCRQGEAVFELPALPGRYTLYKIER
ncbi:MAG: permease [Clostridia bacterium]|nr:permease [Clostridia bacterium]